MHTCYSPVRHSPAGEASFSPAAVRLACVKPAASVHPEPGSNSPLLVYIVSYFLLQKIVCLVDSGLLLLLLIVSWIELTEISCSLVLHLIGRAFVCLSFLWHLCHCSFIRVSLSAIGLGRFPFAIAKLVQKSAVCKFFLNKYAICLF